MLLTACLSAYDLAVKSVEDISANNRLLFDRVAMNPCFRARCTTFSFHSLI